LNLDLKEVLKAARIVLIYTAEIFTKNAPRPTPNTENPRFLGGFHGGDGGI